MLPPLAVHFWRLDLFSEAVYSQIVPGLHLYLFALREHQEPEVLTSNASWQELFSFHWDHQYRTRTRTLTTNDSGSSIKSRFVSAQSRNRSRNVITAATIFCTDRYNYGFLCFKQSSTKSPGPCSAVSDVLLLDWNTSSSSFLSRSSKSANWTPQVATITPLTPVHDWSRSSNCRMARTSSQKYITFPSRDTWTQWIIGLETHQQTTTTAVYAQRHWAALVYAPFCSSLVQPEIHSPWHFTWPETNGQHSYRHTKRTTLQEAPLSTEANLLPPVPGQAESAKANKHATATWRFSPNAHPPS